MNKETETLYIKLTQDLANLEPEQRFLFVQNSLCFLIAVMRGEKGKQFADEYLQAAIADNIKLVLDSNKTNETIQ